MYACLGNGCRFQSQCWNPGMCQHMALCPKYSSSSAKGKMKRSLAKAKRAYLDEARCKPKQKKEKKKTIGIALHLVDVRLGFVIPIVNIGLVYSSYKKEWAKRKSQHVFTINWPKHDQMVNDHWNLAFRERSLRLRSAGSSRGERKLVRKDRTWDKWALQPPIILTTHAKQRLHERRRLPTSPRFVKGTNKTVVATFVPKKYIERRRKKLTWERQVCRREQRLIKKWKKKKWKRRERLLRNILLCRKNKKFMWKKKNWKRRRCRKNKEFNRRKVMKRADFVRSGSGLSRIRLRETKKNKFHLNWFHRFPTLLPLVSPLAKTPASSRRRRRRRHRHKECKKKGGHAIKKSSSVAQEMYACLGNGCRFQSQCWHPIMCQHMSVCPKYSSSSAKGKMKLSLAKAKRPRPKQKISDARKALLWEAMDKKLKNTS